MNFRGNRNRLVPLSYPSQKGPSCYPPDRQQTWSRVVAGEPPEWAEGVCREAVNTAAETWTPAARVRIRPNGVSLRGGEKDGGGVCPRRSMPRQGGLSPLFAAPPGGGCPRYSMSRPGGVYPRRSMPRREGSVPAVRCPAREGSVPGIRCPAREGSVPAVRRPAGRGLSRPPNQQFYSEQ
jgi:hypothetical protein